MPVQSTDSTPRPLEARHPTLSICIATYNRGSFIRETLDSILGQLVEGVELVVVDGCSPDNTAVVMGDYISRDSRIRYYREAVNSGVDGDYDKAVGYARGDYCWLMTDDDLLSPNAVKRVLAAIDDNIDLLVVDAEIRNVDFSVKLEKSRFGFDSDRDYAKGEHDLFFSEVANHLSYIGSVIIRRESWMSRERVPYYGTVFIHIGVIFQHPPLEFIRVISEPLVIIRYGNAMWTPRSFDIWMFKWPKLIWSFSDYSDRAKRSVCFQQPWRKLKSLFEYRAKGAYTIAEYRKYFLQEKNIFVKFSLFFIAVFPANWANFLSVIYVLKNRSKNLTIYELSLSKNASGLSHFYCRKFVK